MARSTARVYIGAESGGFYALNETTGTVVWHRQLDTTPAGTPCPVRGISSTAAVAADPVTGTSTVYVSGRPVPVCAQRGHRRAVLEDRARPGGLEHLL